MLQPITITGGGGDPPTLLVAALWAGDRLGGGVPRPHPTPHGGGGGRGAPGGPPRVYVTCSMHCTVMQVSLDWPASDLEGVRKAFEGNEWSQVRPLSAGTPLTRKVRCNVCTTTIKPL